MGRDSRSDADVLWGVVRIIVPALMFAALWHFVGEAGAFGYGFALVAASARSRPTPESR